MPAFGDQHKPSGSTTANPFEEARPRISEYTAQEIATLQSRLDKQLGPEYISSRPGAAGQKVHYLAAEKVINLANEIFGFNGWSSGIQNIQIDFVDENPQTGKISLGLSVIVRVTLKDGTYHEDIGYGHTENCKGKAAAFEKAKKEGTTDGLKRALRTFGNVLGNCVYDKDYVAKVTKVKVGAGKWDVDSLHRHPDFVTKKEPEPKLSGPLVVSKESTSTEVDVSFDIGDFDDVEFDENDFSHPDEIILPEELASTRPAVAPAIGGQHPTKSPMLNGTATPSMTNIANAPFAHSRPPSDPEQNKRLALQGFAVNPGHIKGATNPGSGPEGLMATGQHQSLGDGQHSSSPGLPSQHFAINAQNHSATGNKATSTAFYSARAAPSIDAVNNVTNAVPSAVPRFNPHSESPSIRKTAGVDHNRSLRLTRELKVDATPALVDQPDLRADQSRRMGASGHVGQSPLPKGPNTSAYRPPTRRGVDLNAAASANGGALGGVDRILTAAKRIPLVDVSNVQHCVTASTKEGADAKRQRLGPSEDANATMRAENALAGGAD